MSNYNQAPEEKLQALGDAEFLGVDYATAPEMLPAGMVSEAENVRFRSRRMCGRPVTRMTGLMVEDFYPWGESVGSGFSGTAANGVLTLSAGTLTQGTFTLWYATQGYQYIRYDTGRIQKLNGTFGKTVFISGASGAFQEGETLTGATSGATGTIEVVVIGQISVSSTAGTYTVAETVTGSISGATATVVSESTAVFLDSQSGYAYLAEDPSGTFVFARHCLEWQGRIDPNQYLTRNVIEQAGQVPIETGIFSDPNGDEYGLVATQTQVWGFRDYERPFAITVNGGIPDGVVDLVQCFDKVLLLRGDALPVLEWDGGASNTFQSIAATSSGDYTEPLPNSRMGIFVKDRVFVVSGRDTLYHSDIGVYTRYKELESGFRVNQGTSDSITALYPFGEEAFLVCFSRSIYLVYNIYGDLSDLSVKRICTGIGVAGRHAICTTGDDIWFMDVEGNIWPLRNVDETRQAVAGAPVSWQIKPLMERYGFAKADACRMIGVGDLVYVAFVGTDANVDEMPSGRQLYKPNYVAVYDKVTQRWAGIDVFWLEFYGVPVNYLDHAGWIQTRYGSRNRLLFAGRYGAIYQYNSDAEQSRWKARSRAYRAGPLSPEQSIRVGVRLYTQNAEVTVRAYGDGVNEEQVLVSDLTRSRTKYLTHGKTAWDASNENLDFETEGREDYALFPDDTTDGIDLGQDGVKTYLKQSYLETYDVTGSPAWLQVEVESTAWDGSCEVGALGVEHVQEDAGWGSQ